MSTTLKEQILVPKQGDALLLADIQNDFLPGGALGITGGDQVIVPLNRAIEVFSSSNLPIIATRDWHPPDHCSFNSRGGPWPIHCVAHTPGAEFSEALRLPTNILVISKATSRDREAYSAFQGTELHQELQALGAKRLFIGGLATDYCVLSTAKDAFKLGYSVFVIRDGVKAVNVRPDDEKRAFEEMASRGAKLIDSSELKATGKHAA